MLKFLHILWSRFINKDNLRCLYMNLDVKNVKISLKVWFFHHRKKKCFPALNAEQKSLKKYCLYLQAESQIVHHVPQLPVLRAVPVIKRVFISGKHAVIEKPHVWKLFENIQMQDAQKSNCGAYLLCVEQRCLQRNAVDERFVKAFRFLPAGNIFNHDCAFLAWMRPRSTTPACIIYTLTITWLQEHTSFVLSTNIGKVRLEKIWQHRLLFSKDI